MWCVGARCSVAIWKNTNLSYSTIKKKRLNAIQQIERSKKPKFLRYVDRYHLYTIIAIYPRTKLSGLITASIVAQSL